jgi:hypothetical protein
MQYKCESDPQFLVQFIPKGLWGSCYTNTLVPDLAVSVILSALSQTVCALLWVDLTLCHMSTIHSTFSSQCTTSNLINTDCLLPIFNLYCTSWFRFMFLTHSGNKANAGEGGVTQAICSYHQFYQSIHITEGVAVMSLSDTLLHKTCVATFRLCQIVSKWKLSFIIYAKSCYNKQYHVNSRSRVYFLVMLKQNSSKRNHVQRELPVLQSQLRSNCERPHVQSHLYEFAGCFNCTTLPNANTRRKTPLEIRFIYSGKNVIYLIFQHCCIISLIFQKFNSFHKYIFSCSNNSFSYPIH